MPDQAVPEAQVHGAPPDVGVHKRGACNLCEAVCGLVFTVHDNRIIAIKGDPDDPLSRGHLCPKAFALKDIHEDADRLKQPVKKVVGANGQVQWQPIGWDEAVDLTARSLVRVREQHGKQAVAVYQGNPTVHNWGNVTHGHLFFSQLNTRQRFSATSADQLPHHLTAFWLYGHQLRIPIPDIDRTQYFLVLGGNPLASNGSMMTVPDVRKRLKSLQSRGGKLVVIDPRRTETAALANEHHFIRPGTDVYWLLAIINIWLSSPDWRLPADWVDMVDGVEQLRQAIISFTPEATAPLTGIDAATTYRIANELRQASAGVCYGRMGVSTQVHGTLCQWAIQVINLLSGNLDREGGTLLTHPAVDLIGWGIVGKGHHGAWRSRVRGAPEFSGELPVAVLAEEILTPGDGQVRALITSCGNPVLSTPNGRQLDQALSTLEFMVSIDFYINETTRHADVILPPTCFVEHDHCDIIFAMLAVRNTAKYVPPVVQPAANALHDWQIYAALAHRYAQYAWSLHSATIMQRLKGMLTRSLLGALSPQRLLQMALWRSPEPVRFAHLKQQPSGVDLGPLRPGKLRQVLRKQGRRVPMVPAPVAQALGDLLQTRHAPPEPQALQLIGRRDIRSNNSWLHNIEKLVAGKPRCLLWMHPDDAQARGLVEGAMACLSSRVGSLTVPVQLTADIRPGVVCLPHGWGHGRDGVRLGVAQAHAGVSINDVTDEQALDMLSGNVAFNGIPVNVAPAA